MTDFSVDLSQYSTGDFKRGKNLLVEILWKLTSIIFFETGLAPFYFAKRVFLRLFGAKIGKGVLIKPRVRITFPWKLTIGSYSWIGEEVWIDNLAPVVIEENVCVSQRAYLCTGNHNYKKSSFDLQIAPIHVSSGAWIAAGAIVGPGIRVEKNAVLTLGSVATQNLETGMIYQGNPAQRIKARSL